MMHRSVLVSVTTILLLAPLARAQTGDSPKEAAANLPEDKQTVLELYLTAQEAYQRWEANPEHVKIIDVRTPEEYVFVGHPAMAKNIPFSFMAYEWNEAQKSVVMKPNPDFVEQVKKYVKPGDTVLVTCRSGQRSGPAVNALAATGYKDAYSVIDGVEGDKVKDSESAFHGKRMRNGWKNAGLPWTYALDPQLTYLLQGEGQDETP